MAQWIFNGLRRSWSKTGKKDNLSFWLLPVTNLLTFTNVKTDLHQEKKFSEIPTIHLKTRHTSKKNVRFCSTVNGMLDCKKICVKDLLFVPPIVWSVSDCWTKIVIFYLCHRLHSRRYKLLYCCQDRFCGVFHWIIKMLCLLYKIYWFFDVQ